LSELDGLPPRIIDSLKANAAREKAGDKGVILLNSTALEIIEQSPNRALREELYRARTGVACDDPKFDNRPLAIEIVRLKDRMAKIMGYKNTAEEILTDRMARNVETVNAFLEANLNAYKPAAIEHFERIKAYALAKDGISDLKPWDTPYYNRLLKEETFKVELEELRPYLSLEKMVVGVLNHAEKLFDIEFRKTRGKYPTHVPGTRVYEIFNKASNNVSSLLYANCYERLGTKNGGAWMDEFRSRMEKDGTVQIPIVTNDCNFEKPVRGKHTFLTLREV